MECNVATGDTTGTGLLGTFSDKREAVRSALATPACLGAGGTAVVASNRPPPFTAFSVLPSMDFQAPSDDNADLFEFSSDAEQ